MRTGLESYSLYAGNIGVGRGLGESEGDWWKEGHTDLLESWGDPWPSPPLQHSQLPPNTLTRVLTLTQMLLSLSQVHPASLWWLSAP